VKQALRVLVMSLAVAAVAGCDVSELAAQSRAQGSFERTLTVNGPVDLSVRTGSGDIVIRIGEGNRVQVVGRISARNRDGDSAADRVKEIEAAPPVQQTGNVITIGHTGDDDRYRNVSIAYELTVPPQTQITARTGSGDQMIGSVRGAVRAQTGSGNISIESTGGALDAQTGSGNIRVNSVSGAINVQTGSGNVDVRQVVKADVRARTGSGDVVLGLPADAAFTLEARTGSGSIDSTHPLTIQGSLRRNHVTGTVRGGGNLVSVTTGSGSIRIQ
jgi:hypothetical protein